MTHPRFLIGIDLGTTNSALAYVDLEEGDAARPRLFRVPQHVASGEVEPRDTLPSFIYFPPGKERAGIVGEHAREQGALTPARQVASAKSWLCHPSADRTAPDPPVGRRPAVRFARRGIERDPAPSARRVERRDRWRARRVAVGTPGDRPHRPRLVRRGSAGTDARGGTGGRPWRPDAAGGAPGGVLRLARDQRHPRRPRPTCRSGAKATSFSSATWAAERPTSR